MRLNKTLLITVAAFTLTACTASQQARTASSPTPRAPHVFKPIAFEYDSKLPEASNFSRQLDLSAWQCDLEASSGSTAVRYGNRDAIAEYSDSLIQCFTRAKAQGDEAVARLKAAKVPEKQFELSQDLYAKWSAYLTTMNPYRPTNVLAKTAYQSAKEALAAEVKFSK